MATFAFRVLSALLVINTPKSYFCWWVKQRCVCAPYIEQPFIVVFLITVLLWALKDLKSKRTSSFLNATVYTTWTDPFLFQFVDSPFQMNQHVNTIPYATKNEDYVGTCLVSGFGLLGPHVSWLHLRLTLGSKLHLNWLQRSQNRNPYRKHLVGTLLWS